MKLGIFKRGAAAVLGIVTLAVAVIMGSVNVKNVCAAEQTKTVTNQEIADYASSWVGKIQYVLGAQGELTDGGSSDCSWFIYHIFNHFGLMDHYARSIGWGYGQVPNTVNIGTNIADALPGDVEFWDEGNNAGHVAIYIGNGKAVACNGYFTADYARTHNGHAGEVEVTSYKTTIGRNPDSIWRMHGNINVNLVRKGGNTIMYRLYHPTTGEHLYTKNIAERNFLTKRGWRDEGKAWCAPENSSSPVYRLYNPNTSEHHFTMNAGERDWLVRLGWNYEGIGWYSDDEKTIPVYRLYNPNAYSMNHHYTTNFGEKEWLVKLGWNYEGIAWYAEK